MPLINFRSTDEDKATIEAIRIHYGLPSAAAVLRMGVKALRIDMEADIQARTKLAKARIRKNSPLEG